jgi:Zn finger protein HypA/HybF involved in hydrogenase expression
MHERGLVRDVLARVEEIAGHDDGRVRAISLRVGAASGTSADAVRRHAELVAEERWGSAPRFDVVESSDILEPGASGLTLVSVRLEG